MAGFVDHRGCSRCGGSGWVCENHQDRPWGEFVAGGCACGAGAPCPGMTVSWPLEPAS